MRVEFVKDTDFYGKGAVVFLPDDAAQTAIKKRDAVAAKGIDSVGEHDTPKEMKRVEMVRTNKRGSAGARLFITADDADKLIARGDAKEFPINGVGDGPPHDKAMKREAVLTK